MISLIEQHREAIADLCRRFDVKRLDLFGSAATGDFDPARSDVDLLIEFNDYGSPSIADQWLGFQEQMERLLGRPIDLTSLRMAKNPHFLEVANRSRKPLYAA
jgi:predicted nucleotidyltransferase